MKKFFFVGLVSCMLFWVGTVWATPITGDPVGLVNSVTPSTNADNYLNGDPHVLLDSNGVDFVRLNFHNETNSEVIFEIRIDAEGAPTDSVTLNNRSPIFNSFFQETFLADSFVDVRLTRTPESDWRFDWTRFYVAAPVPEPGTLLLLGSGLAGLGVVTWRRRKNG